MCLFNSVLYDIGTTLVSAMNLGRMLQVIDVHSGENLSIRRRKPRTIYETVVTTGDVATTNG